MSVVLSIRSRSAGPYVIFLTSLLLVLLTSEIVASAQERARDPERRPVVLDRILVVVNGQPLTRSRVEFYRAYLEHTQGGGLDWPRVVPSPALLSPEELVRVVVIDELLFEAASRVETLRVSEQALRERLDRLRESFSSEAEYERFVARHELTGDAQREFFSRRLRVEGYIALKLGGRRVSPQELRDYFESHPDQYRGSSFEAVKEEITRRIYQDRSLERFEQWIEDLYARAVITVPSRASLR